MAKDYKRLYAKELVHQIEIHVQANNHCVDKGDKSQYLIHDAEVQRLSKLYDEYLEDICPKG